MEAAKEAHAALAELAEEVPHHVPHEGDEMAFDDPFSMMTPFPLGIRQVVVI